MLHWPALPIQAILIAFARAETSMKFTDGYWHMRPGITPHFPIHVHDVDIEPDAMTIYSATKRLNMRGDTLNLPLLTVRFSSM
jgi:alpha-D-xyloside xylohydrolase